MDDGNIRIFSNKFIISIGEIVVEGDEEIK
jgi:hypothetical protein